MLEKSTRVWVTDQAYDSPSSLLPAVEVFSLVSFSAESYRQLLDLMRINTRLNVPSADIHVSELNWGEEVPPEIPAVDLILAADCVYFEVPSHPGVLGHS